MYINTETLEWPISELEIKALHPNTSFPAEFIAPEPFAPIYGTAEPTYNTMTQGVEQVTPTLIGDGKWMQTWQVYELTPEQIAANEEQARQATKATAESLLQQTDWTATVDINNPQFSNPYLGNQDAFLAYRSQVRQIAINPPVIVEVWPTKPDEVWSV